MTKFQTQLATVLRRFSLGVLFLAVLLVVGIHVFKMPLLGDTPPPVIEEPVEVKIEVVYVIRGDNIILREGPSQAFDPITMYGWCKSFIVFQRLNEWVEVGDTEPMGWMHEAFLSDNKPPRCLKITR